jgi:hypothetical protein
MSINDLNDEDLFDYLMNSEYENNLKPEEYQYLLNKWKYFYRIIHGKYNILKNDHLSFNEKISKKETKYKNEIKNYKEDLNKTNNLLNSLKNKKLTLKERFLGKLKIN